MLKKQYRLHSSARFAEVRERGKTVAHPLAVMIFLPNDLPHSRFGFSVSRRIGKAAKRNRAKRLLREAVRLQLLNMAPGYDVVFIARRPIGEATFAQVFQAVQSLVQRAGLWVLPAPAVGDDNEIGAVCETDRVVDHSILSSDYIKDASS